MASATRSLTTSLGGWRRQRTRRKRLAELGLPNLQQEIRSTDAKLTNAGIQKFLAVNKQMRRGSALRGASHSKCVLAVLKYIIPKKILLTALLGLRLFGQSGPSLEGQSTQGPITIWLFEEYVLLPPFEDPPTCAEGATGGDIRFAPVTVVAPFAPLLGAAFVSPMNFSTCSKYCGESTEMPLASAS